MNFLSDIEPFMLRAFAVAVVMGPLCALLGVFVTARRMAFFSDTIAHGVITACKAVNLKVPLVVRMKGTNEDLGKKMLAESGLPIISADTMAQAAQKVVAALH